MALTLVQKISRAEFSNVLIKFNLNLTNQEFDSLFGIFDCVRGGAAVRVR